MSNGIFSGVPPAEGGAGGAAGVVGACADALVTNSRVAQSAPARTEKRILFLPRDCLPVARRCLSSPSWRKIIDGGQLSQPASLRLYGLPAASLKSLNNPTFPR